MPQHLPVWCEARQAGSCGLRVVLRYRTWVNMKLKHCWALVHELSHTPTLSMCLPTSSGVDEGCSHDDAQLSEEEGGL
jgi:hypothetical protein